MTTTSQIFAPLKYPEILSIVEIRLASYAVPFVRVGKASIGSSFWLCVTVSLDARETWSHGIFENSRHACLSVVIEDGKFVVENFSGGSKRDFAVKPWRKRRFTTLEAAADAIGEWCKVNA